jgi:hypothetical protein
LAEIIGQASAYTVKYRYEADQYFYAALADALGGLDASEVFVVRQVLESPLYNISSRNVGWEIGARGASVVTGLGTEGASGSSYVEQFAGFATLLDGNTGLLVTERLTLGLDARAESTLDEAFDSPGENVVEAEIEAAVNRDHTQQWASALTASITQTMHLEDKQGAPTFEARAETNVALGIRGVAGAAIELRETAGDETEPEWMALASFRIFLL